MARKKIGVLLVQKGYITDIQLIAALSHQRKWKTKLGQSLIELGYLEDDQLFETLGEQLGMEVVNLRKIDIPPDICKKSQKEICKQFSAVPFAKDNGNYTVAVSEPDKPGLAEAMAKMLGGEVKLVLSAPLAIDAKIRKLPDRTPVASVQPVKKAFVRNHNGDLTPLDTPPPAPAEDDLFLAEEIPAGAPPEAELSAGDLGDSPVVIDAPSLEESAPVEEVSLPGEPPASEEEVLPPLEESPVLMEEAPLPMSETAAPPGEEEILPPLEEAPELPVMEEAPPVPLDEAPELPVMEEAPPVPMDEAPELPVMEEAPPVPLDEAPELPVMEEAPPVPLDEAPELPVMEEAPPMELETTFGDEVPAMSPGGDEPLPLESPHETAAALTGPKPEGTDVVDLADLLPPADSAPADTAGESAAPPSLEDPWGTADTSAGAPPTAPEEMEVFSPEEQPPLEEITPVEEAPVEVAGEAPAFEPPPANEEILSPEDQPPLDPPPLEEAPSLDLPPEESSLGVPSLETPSSPAPEAEAGPGLDHDLLDQRIQALENMARQRKEEFESQMREINQALEEMKRLHKK